MLSFSFILITLLCLLLFYKATGKNSKVLLACIAWLVFTGSLAWAGFFENTNAIPPRFLIVLLGSTGLCIFLYSITKRNKPNTPYLLAIHGLRLPVELVLYELYLQGQVPVLMTFKGWNFDILTGISALMMLAYVLLTKRTLPRSFMLAWNLAGLALLVTIVGIAILSSPLPLQQLAFDQPNTAVLKFPFVFLPALVVPLVFTSHFLLLKYIYNKE